MQRLVCGLAAIGLTIATSGAVSAASFTPAPPPNYTGINTNSLDGGGAGVSQDGSSKELLSVLANYYGGGAAIVGGSIYGTLSITGGTLGSNQILLVRQQDSGGTGNLNLNGSNAGSANDGVWQGDANVAVNLTATAIIASDSQTFGYLNESDNTLHPIFSGSQGSLPASVNGLPMGSTAFAWYDSPNNANTFYSDASKNTTPRGTSAYTTEDHMITWEVFYNNTSTPLGSGNLATWLVAFEDTPFSQGSDEDYNDLVVQISGAVDPPPVSVPVPDASWMGIVTLIGIVAVAVARRRPFA